MENFRLKICLNVQNEEALVKNQILDLGSYTIGSSDCDLSLSYPTVSRQHGLIFIENDSVFYTDTGSRNGSYLDGHDQRLQSNDKLLWQEGTKIAVGPFHLSWSKATELSESYKTTEYTELYGRLIQETPQQAGELFSEALQNHRNPDKVLEVVHREYHGNGPLQEILAAPNCREILINAYNEIFADLGEGLKPFDTHFASEETYKAWAVRTAHNSGRRLDLQRPICEATLANGARFHAVMNPISAKGLIVAIRRFSSAPITEGQALASGWIDQKAMIILKSLVENRLNAVISGGTSTGKTSLLNFLCQYLNRHERIITVEDTVELTPPVSNLVQLQARNSNSDGVGEVTLRQLVQCALRLRPDRIIVGECRGPEVLEMLQALNTGHPGSLTTIHANSTVEALQRLELLALLGASNLSVESIRQWINSSVNVIIQVNRSSTGHRSVAEISAVTPKGLNVLYKKNDNQMAPRPDWQTAPYLMSS